MFFLKMENESNLRDVFLDKIKKGELKDSNGNPVKATYKLKERSSKPITMKKPGILKSKTFK